MSARLRYWWRWEGRDLAEHLLWCLGVALVLAALYVGVAYAVSLTGRHANPDAGCDTDIGIVGPC